MEAGLQDKNPEVLMNNLNNKIVLITGNLTPVEISITNELLQNGASVIISSSDEIELANHKLEKFRNSIQYFQCNFLIEKQVKNLFLNINNKFGRLDAAINNSSLIQNFNTNLIEYSETDWNQVIDKHLKSIWICMKYEIIEMLKSQTGGSIVNIGTIGGVVGLEGMSPYSAAHHGLVGLTKNSASELAKKMIRINTICSNLFTLDNPEPIKNKEIIENQILKNTPIKRIIKSEEIAKSALWLCSSDSSYVTGTAIMVDGGYTAI